MSMTIACPQCGQPMDVPAYPGDGVYTKHTCNKEDVMTASPKTPRKPRVKLIGEDGNSFFILGACARAAKAAGWSPAQWSAVRTAMMAGDYDHLLATAMEHFDVR
jgi:hypothetical protein